MTTTRPDSPTAQAHKGATGSEVDAQRRMAPKAAAIRERVLAIVACREDGMTSLEAYQAYCQVHGEPAGGPYSVFPRLSELSRPSAGYLAKTDKVRDSRAVYVVTDKGLDWIGRAAA